MQCRPKLKKLNEKSLPGTKFDKKHNKIKQIWNLS